MENWHRDAPYLGLGNLRSVCALVHVGSHDLGMYMPTREVILKSLKILISVLPDVLQIHMSSLEQGSVLAYSMLNHRVLPPKVPSPSKKQ